LLNLTLFIQGIFLPIFSALKIEQGESQQKILKQEAAECISCFSLAATLGLLVGDCFSAILVAYPSLRLFVLSPDAALFLTACGKHQSYSGGFTVDG